MRVSERRSVSASNTWLRSINSAPAATPGAKTPPERSAASGVDCAPAAACVDIRFPSVEISQDLFHGAVRSSVARVVVRVPVRGACLYMARPRNGRGCWTTEGFYIASVAYDETAVRPLVLSDIGI